MLRFPNSGGTFLFCNVRRGKVLLMPKPPIGPGTGSRRPAETGTPGRKLRLTRWEWCRPDSNSRVWPFDPPAGADRFWHARIGHEEVQRRDNRRTDPPQPATDHGFCRFARGRGKRNPKRGAPEIMPVFRVQPIRDRCPSNESPAPRTKGGDVCFLLRQHALDSG